MLFSQTGVKEALKGIMSQALYYSRGSELRSAADVIYPIPGIKVYFANNDDFINARVSIAALDDDDYVYVALFDSDAKGNKPVKTPRTVINAGTAQSISERFILVGGLWYKYKLWHDGGYVFWEHDVMDVDSM
jgi:hypothetical protein